MLMYDSSNDPPNNDNGSSNSNMWTVLATTERWLSNILGQTSAADNPYTRKEVSYVCEAQADEAMIIANIWRRLREARERGELHGQTEEDRRLEQGKTYIPSTYRQTQVIVIPNNEPLNKSFKVFDGVIGAINQSRRNARDYVTDLSLQKLDERMEGESDVEWSVAVNCAHLHPNFGDKTKEQIVEELMKENEAGESDLNLVAHKAKRALARQSPYPTIVIETRSTPPIDFGQSPPIAKVRQAVQEQVSSETVAKLEALFGMSATFSHPMQGARSLEEEEDAFYSAIGSTMDEIHVVTPMILAQNWVVKYDADFDIAHASFTLSDCQHVDAGYEFVFTNMAMHAQLPDVHRQYLVMSSFLSSSATSLEKFANEIKNMIQNLDSLAKVQVLTMHPEHIERSMRSPVPILCLNWVK